MIRMARLRVGRPADHSDPLRQIVTKVLSSEADVLEQVVVELVQLPPRTGAPAPQPDGGDDPPDYRQRRDKIRLGATWRSSGERQIQQWPQRPFLLHGPINRPDYSGAVQWPAR